MNPEYSSHSLRGLIAQFKSGAVVCVIPNHGWIDVLTSIAEHLESLEQNTHQRRESWLKTTGLPKRLQRILWRAGISCVDEITEANLEGVYQCGSKSMNDLLAFRDKELSRKQNQR